MRCTCEKMERELGWKPAISLDEGLRQTIDWYRTNTKWMAGVRGGEYLILLREILRESRFVSPRHCAVGTQVFSLARSRQLPPAIACERFLIQSSSCVLRWPAFRFFGAQLPVQRIETTLPGVYELRPKVFRDARGFFMETYHRERFAEMGIPDLFVQDNHSSLRKRYAARASLSIASCAGQALPRG